MEEGSGFQTRAFFLECGDKTAAFPNAFVFKKGKAAFHSAPNLIACL
jgi:hypothetical protein